MAFANDVISMEDLRVRMQEENEREESIRAQLLSQVGVEKPTSKLSQQEVIEVANSIKENWGHLELEHKKLIILTLFAEIVVNTNGESIGGPGRRVPCEIISFKTNEEAVSRLFSTSSNPKQTSALSKGRHSYH